MQGEGPRFRARTLSPALEGHVSSVTAYRRGRDDPPALAADGFEVDGRRYNGCLDFGAACALPVCGRFGGQSVTGVSAGQLTARLGLLRAGTQSNRPSVPAWSGRWAHSYSLKRVSFLSPTRHGA